MKTKCLLYCTIAKPLLRKNVADIWWLESKEFARKNKRLGIEMPPSVNGTIALECEVECERFEFDTMSRKIFSYWYENGHEVDYKKMCLTYDELWNYLGDNVGCALHISNLKVFDKPLKLSEVKSTTQHLMFEKDLEVAENMDEKIQARIDKCFELGIPTDEVANCVELTECNEWVYGLDKAPQNMMWVWYKGERYALISIRSNWYCKIANGEKTIEVRKKILKGMI